jgi:hypothetical protein
MSTELSAKVIHILANKMCAKLDIQYVAGAPDDEAWQATLSWYEYKATFKYIKATSEYADVMAKRLDNMVAKYLHDGTTSNKEATA